MNRQLLGRARFEIYRLSHEWVDKRFHSRETRACLDRRSALAVVGREVFGRDSAEVESFQKEFRETAAGTQYTLAEIGDYKSPYALNYGVSNAQMEALFVVVRMLRPEIVLETGVANGLSSTAILCALEQNGTGRLYSVDPGKELGCMIPKRVMSRWVLINSASPEALYRWTASRPVDLFHHDSLHIYRQMRTEYEAATRIGSERLVIMSDDVLANDAFPDFCNEHGLPYFVLGQEGKYEGLCAVGRHARAENS